MLRVRIDIGRLRLAEIGKRIEAGRDEAMALALAAQQQRAARAIHGGFHPRMRAENLALRGC